VNHPRGFALCAQRSATQRCYCLQAPPTDKVKQWSDNAFWEEFKLRLDPKVSQ